MSTITVKKLDDSTFEVEVEAEGKASTTHIVTVASDYVAKLGAGGVTVEELIGRSFDFLLTREQNTSIMRRFNLSVIAQYFPEYEHEIIKMLR